VISYIDTSAALKLLIEEPESAALAEELTAAAARGERLVASMLLHTELHCAARRRAKIPAPLINTVLNSINLVDVAREDLMYAAALAGGLRSADAIHLATAIRLQADTLVAYDAGLLAAGSQAGLTLLCPAARQAG
jgi:predicted nucleic acid-binding protein